MTKKKLTFKERIAEQQRNERLRKLEEEKIEEIRPRTLELITSQEALFWGAMQESAGSNFDISVIPKDELPHYLSSGILVRPRSSKIHPFRLYDDRSVVFGIFQHYGIDKINYGGYNPKLHVDVAAKLFDEELFETLTKQDVVTLEYLNRTGAYTAFYHMKRNKVDPSKEPNDNSFNGKILDLDIGMLRNTSPQELNSYLRIIGEDSVDGFPTIISFGHLVNEKDEIIVYDASGIPLEERKSAFYKDNQLLDYGEVLFILDNPNNDYSFYYGDIDRTNIKRYPSVDVAYFHLNNSSERAEPEAQLDVWNERIPSGARVAYVMKFKDVASYPLQTYIPFLAFKDGKTWQLNKELIGLRRGG